LQVRLAIYIKGAKRRCTDVPTALRKAVALCREAPNAGGREAHTIALFALQFYDTLPRITVFAQDDAPPPRHRSQLMRLAGLDAAGMARWTEAAEREPFTTPDACLCRAVVEDWWRPCPLEVPFPKDMPRCYGDTYWPMRWFMESFLDFPRAGEQWQSMRWPEAAQLAVPAWAVRSRPRAVYSVALALLNGSRTDGKEGSEGVGAEAYDGPLLYRSAQLGQRPWSPHEWAHVFERLWFAVFDARYDPQPLPREGPASGKGAAGAPQTENNASTAPQADAAEAALDARRAAAAAGWPVVVPPQTPAAAAEAVVARDGDAAAPAAPAADVAAFLARAGLTRDAAAGVDAPNATLPAPQPGVEADGDDDDAMPQPDAGQSAVPDAAAFLALAATR